MKERKDFILNQNVNIYVTSRNWFTGNVFLFYDEQKYITEDVGEASMLF